MGKQVVNELNIVKCSVMYIATTYMATIVCKINSFRQQNQQQNSYVIINKRLKKQSKDGKSQGLLSAGLLFIVSRFKVYCLQFLVHKNDEVILPLWKSLFIRITNMHCSSCPNIYQEYPTFQPLHSYANFHTH